jgi:hypothetical protein
MQRIATATKSVDLHGAGKHGFTNGDPQTSVFPTQISADWMNTLQEEMAYAAEFTGLTLDADDNTQLTKAIYLAGRDWRPDALGEFGFHRTFRNYQNSDERDTWVNRQTTHTALNVASGTTGTVLMAVPNALFFVGTMKCIISRTDITTTQAAYVWHFSGRSVGGAATITAFEEALSEIGSLAIDNAFFNPTGLNLQFQAQFNAAPAAKKYNMAATWEVQVVSNYAP